MDPTIVAAIVSLIAVQATKEKLSEATNERLISFLKILREKLREKNPSIEVVLTPIDRGGAKSLPEKSIEILAESLEEEMQNDPEFAKDFQEKAKNFTENINAENPEIAKEINNKIKDILNRFNDIEDRISNIQMNISNADFIGRDNTLFVSFQRSSATTVCKLAIMQLLGNSEGGDLPWRLA